MSEVMTFRTAVAPLSRSHVWRTAGEFDWTVVSARVVLVAPAKGFPARSVIPVVSWTV